MKNLEEILKKFGIGCKYNEEARDQIVFFSLEVVNGEIEQQEMRKRFFVEKLNNFEKIFIEDIDLFVQKFNLTEKWKPEIREVLKGAPLTINSVREVFEIQSLNNRPLEEFFWRWRYWSDRNFFTQKQEEELFEHIKPGFLVKRLFNREEAEDELNEELARVGGNIAIQVKKMDLAELQDLIFDDTMLVLEEALNKIKAKKTTTK